MAEEFKNDDEEQQFQMVEAASSPAGNDNDDDDGWWKGLVVGFLNDPNILNSMSSIQQLSKYGSNKFLDEEISKEMYYTICIVVWLAKLVEQDDDDTASADPNQLWRIVKETMNSTSTAKTNFTDDGEAGVVSSNTAGTQRTLSQMILPSTMEGTIYEPGFSSSNNEYHALEKLIRFFTDFYKECERPCSDQPRLKRRRLNRHSSNILSGQYQLPTAYLLVTVIYNILKNNNQITNEDDKESNMGEEGPLTQDSLTWESLHREVHRQLKSTFKSMTTEHIQGGLAILGLELLKCGKPLKGLTPKVLMEDYISRMGYVKAYTS